MPRQRQGSQTRLQPAPPLQALPLLPEPPKGCSPLPRLPLGSAPPPPHASTLGAGGSTSGSAAQDEAFHAMPLGLETGCAGSEAGCEEKRRRSKAPQPWEGLPRALALPGGMRHVGLPGEAAGCPRERAFARLTGQVSARLERRGGQR